MIIPENLLLAGGSFEYKTSCAQVLGWLEKKDEEKGELQFWVSTVSVWHLITVSLHYYCCCIDWTSLCKLFLMLCCVVTACLAHLDARCEHSKVKQSSNFPQQTAFQLDSCVCATCMQARRSMSETQKRDHRMLATIFPAHHLLWARSIETSQPGAHM